MLCRTPKIAIQKCFPPIPVVLSGCCGPRWLSSHLLSLSLRSHPPGPSWPARSSFAFCYPDHFSSGDVTDVSPQDMSNASPSPYPYLHATDTGSVLVHLCTLLIWDLVWPENSEYLSHWYPLKTIQFAHVYSSDSLHFCPIHFVLQSFNFSAKSASLAFGMATSS